MTTPKCKQIFEEIKNFDDFQRLNLITQSIKFLPLPNTGSLIIYKNDDGTIETKRVKKYLEKQVRVYNLRNNKGVETISYEKVLNLIAENRTTTEVPS